MLPPADKMPSDREAHSLELWCSDSQSTMEIVLAPNPARDGRRNNLRVSRKLECACVSNPVKGNTHAPGTRVPPCGNWYGFHTGSTTRHRLIQYGDQPEGDSQPPSNHPDLRGVCRVLIAHRLFIDVRTERRAVRYEIRTLKFRHQNGRQTLPFVVAEFIKSTHAWSHSTPA